MSVSLFVVILAILLVGLFSLTALNSVMRRLQKRELKKQLNSIGKFFFYRYIHLTFFPRHEFEGLFFASTFALNLVRFLFAITSLFLIISSNLLGFSTDPETNLTKFFVDLPSVLAYLGVLFLIFFILGDYLPRIFGSRYPNLALKLSVIPASLFMLLLSPFIYVFLKLSYLFSHTLFLDHLSESHTEAKQEILEMIQDADVSAQLDIHDKKLLGSVMAFRDRIAREVMVPRVDVFSLSEETTIAEAAAMLLKEGYSRTPVYKTSLDNIIGVLMYKDILAKYMEYGAKGNDKKILAEPISTLIKNVLYTPETKKISQLLQEFRKQQVHLAIVVDEYGGTEGIVTIEDILEVIVGDIADEYDTEEDLFIPLPQGGWIVDTRMNILDVEEQLGIEFPQEGDYDTIGGYIFHEAGMIPPKGFIIRKPNFELEVLRSNDRRVEKIRIQALAAPQSEVETSQAP